MSTFAKLPTETIQHIATYARADDVRARTGHGHGSGRPHASSISSNSGKASWSRGHARRQSAYWRADSALSLLKTSSWMHEAVLPVVWKSLDFAEIPEGIRKTVIESLTTSHGRHVRQLQLKIALAPAVSESTDVSVLSISEAISILSSVPKVSWLEIELLSLHEDAYISRLPTGLEQAILSHSSRLKHFGISAEGSSATTGLQFQLDERMVADMVCRLTSLESLTLHRINHDILLKHSPLFDAISSLKRLKKLYALEISVNAYWTREGFQGDLRELSLVSCPDLSPAVLDGLLEHHNSTLVHLALVNLPRAREGIDTPASTARYRLSSLRSLHIETDNEDVDTIAYLDRFGNTQLSELVLRYAPGIQMQELEGFILARKLKHLQSLVIGLHALRGAGREGLHLLKEKLEGKTGMRLRIGEKSSLVVVV